MSELKWKAVPINAAETLYNIYNENSKPVATNCTRDIAHAIIGLGQCYDMLSGTVSDEEVKAGGNKFSRDILRLISKADVYLEKMKAFK